MVGKKLCLGAPEPATLDSWAVEQGNVAIWKLCKLWKGIITAFLSWKLRRVDELEEEARVRGVLNNFTKTAEEQPGLGILPLRKGHKQEGVVRWPLC